MFVPLFVHVSCQLVHGCRKIVSVAKYYIQLAVPVVVQKSYHHYGKTNALCPMQCDAVTLIPIDYHK